MSEPFTGSFWLRPQERADLLHLFKLATAPNTYGYRAARVVCDGETLKIQVNVDTEAPKGMPGRLAHTLSLYTPVTSWRLAYAEPMAADFTTSTFRTLALVLRSLLATTDSALGVEVYASNWDEDKVLANLGIDPAKSRIAHVTFTTREDSNGYGFDVRTEGAASILTPRRGIMTGLVSRFVTRYEHDGSSVVTREVFYNTLAESDPPALAKPRKVAA